MYWYQPVVLCITTCTSRCTIAMLSVQWWNVIMHLSNCPWTLDTWFINGHFWNHFSLLFNYVDEVLTVLISNPGIPKSLELTCDTVPTAHWSPAYYFSLSAWILRCQRHQNHCTVACTFKQRQGGPTPTSCILLPLAYYSPSLPPHIKSTTPQTRV